jgi:hypothetical protein
MREQSLARALRGGIERFPVAFLDADAVEVRLLCDHRDALVSERTRLLNRLRINLVILDPELEAKIPSRKLDHPGQDTDGGHALPQAPPRPQVLSAAQRPITTPYRASDVPWRSLRVSHSRTEGEL